MESKVKFDELDIDEKFKYLLKDYKKQVQENVLFDILSRFYFADWTRGCDYSNMTSEEVVNSAMQVCRQIEKDYNYRYNDDIFDCPFVCEDCDI